MPAATSTPFTFCHNPTCCRRRPGDRPDQPPFGWWLLGGLILLAAGYVAWRWARR
ncbi:MAG: hypothetical protein M5U34_08330 [Chloroflexi bacterium]|nr:hypothetical protein [Chloroflexota bacterium]